MLFHHWNKLTLTEEDVELCMYACKIGDIMFYKLQKLHGLHYKQ